MLACLANISCQNICHGATWRSVHMFTTHYTISQAVATEQMWAKPYCRLHFLSHPCTHLHTDHCSQISHMWNTYRGHHSKKERRLLTSNWRLFEMCGPYLYSTTRPPSPLLWTGLHNGKRETGEASTQTAFYTLSCEHKGMHCTHAGQ